MTPEQHEILIEEITRHTADVVREVVNGKIDKIDVKMDLLSGKYDQHAKDDALWQETANPVIKLANNLSGSGKALIIFAGGLSIIIGLLLAIKQLFIK